MEELVQGRTRSQQLLVERQIQRVVPRSWCCGGDGDSLDGDGLDGDQRGRGGRAGPTCGVHEQNEQQEQAGRVQHVVEVRERSSLVLRCERDTRRKRKKEGKRLHPHLHGG